MSESERFNATGPEPVDGESMALPTYSLLSVIVPVFNERVTVAEVIRRIRAVEVPVDIEIIVVDDGSSDGTEKVLTALGDSTVRILTHPVNRGKGAAIRTGMASARGDLLLIQDADLEYDPQTGRACSIRSFEGRPRSSTAAGSPASVRTCCRSTGSAIDSCRW